MKNIARSKVGWSRSLKNELEQRSCREWQARLELDARREERRQVQARLSEWDARLEDEERHPQLLRGRLE